MIEVITFDLWDTLFVNKSYSSERLQFLKQFLENKKISFSAKGLNSAFKSSFFLPERNYEENRHIYTKDRISTMLDILAIDLEIDEKRLINDEFEEIMLKNPPQLKKGVKHIIEALSPEYKIGLISNTGITPGRIISKVF